MGIEKKVGQLFIFGWNGRSAEECWAYSEHARILIEDIKVGGVVLLGRNIAPEIEKTVETINELQSHSEKPLFIAIDQEGGMAAHLREPATVFPSNMALGATAKPKNAFAAARATAAELLAVGINYNFAPCVDVNNNPENPIIGTRSFGEDPDAVAEFAVQAVRGYQDGGVVCCAKHFPGHGDTSVDSHLALPIIPYGYERLEAVELVPFRACIAAGVDSIMTTHIIFKELDPALPATLSRNVLTGLLREKMGFEGLVITDCMEMKAIADNFGHGESAVLAIEAGADIVLACHTLSVQQEMFEAVLRAVKEGRISEDRIDSSIARADRIRAKYRLEEKKNIDSSIARRILGCREHRRLQWELAQQAVTLVRNEDGILPLRICESCSILVTGLHRTVPALAEAIRARHPNVQEILLPEGDARDIARAVSQAEKATICIVPTCPREPWQKPIDETAQTELVKRLISSGVPVVVVAVREPYDIRNFPEVRTYLATYGYRPPMLEAAAAVIFGEVPALGTLPVTL